jgi:pantoate--beta-alanine ligase
MTEDLDLPVEVVGCPLVREADGLALSSRNAYLTDDERRAATILSGALYMASEAVVGGVRDAAAVRSLIVDTVARSPLVQLDYAEVVDAATLEPLERIDGDTLVALAAFVGKARLIDNVTITFRGDTACPDLGVLTASSGTTEAL